MRESFEAVAEFLARHGGLDEYDAVLRTMENLGWAIDENHPARWRALFTVLRQELSESRKEIDYVFVFGRLLQLTLRIPSEMASAFFESELALHVIVSRFQAAFESYDAVVFRDEKDVLLHTENIYANCRAIEGRLFPRTTVSGLRSCLLEIKQAFEQDEPKAVWDTLCHRYLLPEVVFRRDMKRVLRRLEDEVFGETQIEKKFPAQDVQPTDKRVIIPRRILESKYVGSSSDWRDLGSVFSVMALSAERPIENRRESIDQAQQASMSDVVGETPPNADHEDRVWSARLPIATPGGGDSDPPSDGDNAMDDAVRQDKATRRSPGKAKTTQSNRQRQAAPVSRQENQSTPQRSRAAPVSAPVSASASEQRPQAPASQPDDRPEEIDDDAPGDGDDDGFLDPARDIPANSRKRRGRKMWKEDEVAALISGLKRYGGQWAVIKKAYPEALRNRSGVDLKDKYRNLVKAKRIPPIRYAEEDE